MYGHSVFLTLQIPNSWYEKQSVLTYVAGIN